MSNSEPIFWFRASLRIKDAPHLHQEIIARLGEGSECHQAGDRQHSNPKRRWPNDIWLISDPLDEKEELGAHLEWVTDFAELHEEFLRSLINRGAIIDIYVSYRCDQDHRGFGLDPRLLSVLVRLGIRFEMSIMT